MLFVYHMMLYYRALHPLHVQVVGNIMAQGYDHQFVEQTPQNLICLICLHVARDPQQVNCCGKLLCRGCLTEHKKRSSNCPHCRGTITSFADRRSNTLTHKYIYKDILHNCIFFMMNRSARDPFTTSSM